jgi:hypothetical protein
MNTKPSLMRGLQSFPTPVHAGQSLSYETVESTAAGSRIKNLYGRIDADRLRSC